jgi:hypothetical protein
VNIKGWVRGARLNAWSCRDPLSHMDPWLPQAEEEKLLQWVEISKLEQLVILRLLLSFLLLHNKAVDRCLGFRHSWLSENKWMPLREKNFLSLLSSLSFIYSFKSAYSKCLLCDRYFQSAWNISMKKQRFFS